MFVDIIEHRVTDNYNIFMFFQLAFIILCQRDFIAATVISFFVDTAIVSKVICASLKTLTIVAVLLKKY